MVKGNPGKICHVLISLICQAQGVNWEPLKSFKQGLNITRFVFRRAMLVAVLLEMAKTGKHRQKCLVSGWHFDSRSLEQCKPVKLLCEEQNCFVN
jgi:hypothetical protein